jgi:hypothetical protein
VAQLESHAPVIEETLHAKKAQGDPEHYNNGEIGSQKKENALHGFQPPVTILQNQVRIFLLRSAQLVQA